ncbi:hypothetical protein ACRAWD_05965 [Caulobacter segnis]
MEGLSPVTTGQIDAALKRSFAIVDSGAFYSTSVGRRRPGVGSVGRASAQNARLKGAGGETSLGVATAKEASSSPESRRSRACSSPSAAAPRAMCFRSFWARTSWASAGVEQMRS